MFIVGMEFRMEHHPLSFQASLAVSAQGMIALLSWAVLLGWYFHSQTKLFPEKTNCFEAVLFLGASMCITAFPMLARNHFHFKGLNGTTMGTVAIGSGAIDDATAWCLLAIVLASFDGNLAYALQNIGGGLAYVGVVLVVVRPLLDRFQNLLFFGKVRAGG